MSETRPTPGPWRWETVEDDGQVEVLKGIVAVLAIADGLGPLPADKALIASAPELLAQRDLLAEALRAAAVSFDYIRTEHAESEDAPGLADLQAEADAAYDYAEAALAKLKP